VSSVVHIPLAEFASVLTRLGDLEKRIAAIEGWRDGGDGVFSYGPCKRCGYGPWDSYQMHPPRTCPRCHSAYWASEPRSPRSRKPSDPPLASWSANRRIRKRMAGGRPPARRGPIAVALDTGPVVCHTAPDTEPAPLVPPPPRLADVLRAKANAPPLEAAPEPSPVAHVAAMPDAVVQAIVEGATVSYDEIKAAKADGGLANGDSGQQGDAPTPQPSDGRDTQRPESPALAAKKAEFFAGFEVPAGEASAPETPFVAPSLAPAPDADDDEFWK
jgi:hypothetical protein